jgi:uncharacterized membrane protein
MSCPSRKLSNGCSSSCPPASNIRAVTLYTAVKFLHILLAMVAVGFNASYAVWLVRARRSVENLEFALKGVKFMDDYLANPAYIGLLISGLGMVLLLPWNLLRSFWLEAAIVLWVIVALLGYGVYTPTLSRQIKVLAAKGPKDEQYRWLDQRAQRVGPALGVIVLVIIGLMVFKPTF